MMGVYEAVKDAAALAQKAGNMDLYRELLDAMQTTLDQQKTIQTLEARNAELEKALAFQNTLEREGDGLWSIVDGAIQDGPYCMRCWDEKGKAIRLHDRETTRWRCPVCDTVVYKPGNEQRGQPLSRRRSTV